MKHEVLHIPGDNGSETLGGVLEAVASFATCVAGQTNAQSALDSLAKIFGASQASLKRLTTVKERAPVRHVTDAGTLWIKTAQGYRALGKSPPVMPPKAMIFALDVHSSGVDVIELQFHDHFIQLPVELTKQLARTLAQTWTHARGCSEQPTPVDNACVQTQDILSAENPYGLTRAETRVCHALRDGRHAAEIATHLGIGIATVRSHLSKIYSKTALPSQVAVMHRLSCANSDTGLS